MEKSFDVISMGELLIDFTTAGKSRQGNGLFELVRAEHPAMYWLC